MATVMLAVFPGRLASEERPIPEVLIEQVPPADAGGPDKTSVIAGRVVGECENCRIVVFAKSGDGDWYIQPLAEAYETPIHGGGWSTETHLGVQYAALLTRVGWAPPMRTKVLPGVGEKVLSVSVVEGRKQQK